MGRINPYSIKSHRKKIVKEVRNGLYPSHPSPPVVKAVRLLAGGSRAPQAPRGIIRVCNKYL